MNKNKVLLTDFNSTRWYNVNEESVNTAIDKFLNRENSLCIGELGHPDTCEIHLGNATHAISDISSEDMKIFGQIEFLNSEKGKLANELFNSNLCELGIRAVGITNVHETIIHDIISWDLIPSSHTYKGTDTCPSYIKRWKEQTRFLSSTTKIIENEFFQKILAMGKEAIPFILDDIEKSPSTLVWALNIINGYKISEEDITIEEACRMWLEKYRTKSLTDFINIL